MTNLKSQQPLISMIFTNTDPRYVGRFDDKQVGNTIVTLERIRELTAFNADWRTSQHGCGSHRSK